MEVPKTITKYLPLLLIVALVLFGIVWRLMPHVPNFAPIGAIALIAGLALGWKKSLWVVLGIMLISDLVVGFYPGMQWTWLSFLLIVGFGLHVKKLAPHWRIPAGVLGSSGLFFIVSNFGTWIASGMYSLDFAGLIQCYVMALPFLKATLLSDLLFTTLLLTAYEAVTMYHFRPFGLVSMNTHSWSE